MSLSNPFEKLNVKRDVEEDDDGQGEFQKVKGKEKNLPIGIEQKKKKTRPKETAPVADEEGFEESEKDIKREEETTKRMKNSKEENIKREEE